MAKIGLHNLIIQNRVRFILELVKKGKDLVRLEREFALLVLEILDALQKSEIALKDGCNCFTKIVYAINLKTHQKLSEDFTDLMNEALILDELGTKYGPNIPLLVKLAMKILMRKTEDVKTSALLKPVAVVRG